MKPLKEACIFGNTFQVTFYLFSVLINYLISGIKEAITVSAPVSVGTETGAKKFTAHAKNFLAYKTFPLISVD